jgi:hypothetical protein
MPKNLTRHRRANKRGGQTVPEYGAPAPAPTYVAPAPAGESWFNGLGTKIGELGAKLDPRKLLPSSDPNAPSTAPSTAPSSSWFGGKRRMRAMRGGNVHASNPLSLATTASPISGISSALAHNWVGGRTRGRGRTRSRALKRSQRRTHARSRSRSRKYGRARH